MRRSLLLLALLLSPTLAAAQNALVNPGAPGASSALRYLTTQAESALSNETVPSANAQSLLLDSAVPRLGIANEWTASAASSTPAARFTGSIFAGTGTTAKPLVLIEPTGATSANWGTAGSYLGINTATGFVGNILDIQVNGASRFRVSQAGSMTSDAGNMNVGGVLKLGGSFDSIISRGAAANNQLGDIDVAGAPVAQTLSAQSASGVSNTAGANLTIKGSAGTGTGAGGDVILQVAPASGSSSTKNTFVTALTAKGTGAGVSIVGTNTNDDATAGQIGEVIESNIASGSSVALTTNTAANLTSVSLTAGDWDCNATMYFLPAATTSITQLINDQSASSATLALTNGGFNQWQGPATVPGASSTWSIVGPVFRIKLASTTTRYAVVRALFTVSTLNVYGTYRCRRER